MLKGHIVKYKVHSVIEFGAGVSTILMRNLGLNITSFETDSEFAAFVDEVSANLLGPEPGIYLWDNKPFKIDKKFDLAFVDGCLPREPQIEMALKTSKLVALDDFVGGSAKRYGKALGNQQRLDDGSTFMAVFKIVQ